MDGDEKAAVGRAIQRLTEENGMPVGRERFVAETGFPQSLWEARIWLTWGEAVREASYELNVMQHRRLTGNDLLLRLAMLARKIGRYPPNAHMTMERRTNTDFPPLGVIASRLGAKSQQAAALRAFVKGAPGFADVEALLLLLLTHQRSSQSTLTMKMPLSQCRGTSTWSSRASSTRIGRSNDHGRRAYEIGLQLPEKLEVVHTIETDDAVGIERYWHERFRDRRRNGEWFLLTTADVAAFTRRRSFM